MRPHLTHRGLMILYGITELSLHWFRQWLLVWNYHWISQGLWMSESDPRWLLTHWGRVKHICLGNLITIGSANGLSPGWHQAIIWTNDGTLLNRPLRTNFSETSIAIHIFSFKKMHLKMSSAKWYLFCLGLNVLTRWVDGTPTTEVTPVTIW